MKFLVDRGDKECCDALGKLYWHGVGRQVTVNKEKAMCWYLQSNKRRVNINKKMK